MEPFGVMRKNRNEVERKKQAIKMSETYENLRNYMPVSPKKARLAIKANIKAKKAEVRREGEEGAVRHAGTISGLTQTRTSIGLGNQNTAEEFSSIFGPTAVAGAIAEATPELMSSVFNVVDAYSSKLSEEFSGFKMGIRKSLTDLNNFLGSKEYYELTSHDVEKLKRLSQYLLEERHLLSPELQSNYEKHAMEILDKRQQVVKQIPLTQNIRNVVSSLIKYITQTSSISLQDIGISEDQEYILRQIVTGAGVVSYSAFSVLYVSMLKLVRALKDIPVLVIINKVRNNPRLQSILQILTDTAANAPELFREIQESRRAYNLDKKRKANVMTGLSKENLSKLMSDESLVGNLAGYTNEKVFKSKLQKKFKSKGITMNVNNLNNANYNNIRTLLKILQQEKADKRAPAARVQGTN